jgi:hypothetical protein
LFASQASPQQRLLSIFGAIFQICFPGSFGKIDLGLAAVSRDLTKISNVPPTPWLDFKFSRGFAARANIDRDRRDRQARACARANLGGPHCGRQSLRCRCTRLASNSAMMLAVISS